MKRSVMRILGTLVLSLYLVATAQAQHGTGRYEYAPPHNAIPQFNPYTGRQELATPGAVPQYNTHTGKYELAPPNATPRYNPYTQRWQLMGPDQNR